MKNSLCELESDDWGTAPADASPMMQRIASLRYKDIRSFSIEDLRLCIGQDIGLVFLLPMALNRLEQHLFCEGMHFKGDLLCNVLRASKVFYIENPALKARARSVLIQATAALHQLDDIDAKTLAEAIAEAIAEFDA
ncbi:contact-dependent growth inhibition system immunity protein [Massilia sp. CF038]|uniref:contact-dependent growth inhibition system immunity protein n=1 Tax=Massilia sp. CF038 TaxID=1881045 RepID=UPI000923F005|nr:contact-dependent growth inhibition system immunity protein [Massilia sp. CF038]SHH23073.1 hypothetical protein SAMN05428948_3423 [Massilia sp. CF038]